MSDKNQASAQPAEQVSDAELSTIVELARAATDAHCEGMQIEPTKEYSNAYFFRTLIRAAPQPAARVAVPLAYLSKHVIDVLRTGCTVATVLSPTPNEQANEPLYAK